MSKLAFLIDYLDDLLIGQGMVQLQHQLQIVLTMENACRLNLMQMLIFFSELVMAIGHKGLIGELLQLLQLPLQVMEYV